MGALKAGFFGHTGHGAAFLGQVKLEVVSAVLIFTLVQLLGDGGWIFNSPWSFYLWNLSVLAYVLLMFIAGWREGTQPSFTMIPGTERNLLYALRLLVGILMFIASADWLIDASRLLREPAYAQIPSVRSPL